MNAPKPSAPKVQTVRPITAPAVSTPPVKRKYFPREHLTQRIADVFPAGFTVGIPNEPPTYEQLREMGMSR
jgi:hypothetical protein